jgi:hypothetical protein
VVLTSKNPAVTRVQPAYDVARHSAERELTTRGGAPGSDLPPYPIVVGVTGHRDITDDALDAVRSCVHDVLNELKTEFGDALQVIIALADGADQLVADVAESLVIETIAVSPMPLDTYRATVANCEKLDYHWDRSVLKFALPELCGSDHPGYAELHYQQLGALLSRRCHLLLALWDGDSTDAAPGGTADVVRMRRGGEYGAEGFINSPLFEGSGSRLDLSPGGPVLQVVAPCRKHGGAVLVAGQSAPRPGDCFLLPGCDDPEDMLPNPIEPQGVIAALGEQVRKDLTRIFELNRQIARFGKLDRHVFETQLGYLRVSEVADPGGIACLHLDRLRRLQAAADTAAQSYQRILFGQFVPAWSFRKMIENGRKVWCETRHLPRVGVLFIFAALVPLAVLLFEIYAHVWRLTWLISGYAAILLGSIAFYYLVVRRQEWQNHFQDYRALAEAMRVQLFWGLAAAPIAASDNYLRKQSGDLGWIRLALRGPALWAAALALSLKCPQYELVIRGWIEDQWKYFAGPSTDKAGLNQRVFERGKYLAIVFLVLGIGAAGALLGLEVLRFWLPWFREHGLLDLWPSWLPVPRDILLVTAATLLAVAAFFTVSINLRAYEAHAHSYALMGRIFRRALDEAKKAAKHPDQFKDLVRELGREALAENAEWLLDHRNRPIEPPR